jgi:hypothetical protein
MATDHPRLRTIDTRSRLLFVLRVVLAAVLLRAGIAKYAGAAAQIDTFDQVGIGQWFRYVIGTIEIAGGVGLLITPIAGLAALAAGSVLVGAVAMEAFVLDDGNPVTPAILLALLAVVAWAFRSRTSTLVARALPTATRRPTS